MNNFNQIQRTSSSSVVGTISVVVNFTDLMAFFFRLKNIYGASELCGVVFATNDRLLTPIESVGVCAPGISFKIARMGEEERDRITSTAPASGLITEPGVEGQMMIRLPNGQQLDKLYFNDPQKTKDSMTEDGFYKTGLVIIHRWM